MVVNIKDLKLPKFHPWFVPHDKTVNELINEGVELSKTNWIAYSIFGYTILTNKDSSSIWKDPRWHNAVKLLADSNYDGDDEFYKQRQSTLVNLEGEDHNRLKKIIAPYFTPSYVNKIRPLVSETVRNSIYKSIGRNSLDMQKHIFDVIPAYIICNLIGIPTTDVKMLTNWSDQIFLTFGLIKPEDMDDVKKMAYEYIAYIDKLILDKKSNLGNDLISDLIRAECDGDSLSNEEINMLIRVVISSGIDSTRGQLGLSFKMLCEDLNLWQKFPNDRELLASEVARTFAMDGVVKQTARFASEDIIYNDVLFPKGTVVFPTVSIPNIKEPDAQPLTFGRGLHYCLGASLATVIVEETMFILSKQFPNVVCDEGVEYKESHRSSAGFVSLPIKLKEIMSIDENIEELSIKLEIAIAMILNNEKYQSFSRNDVLKLIEKSFKSVTHKC